MDFYELAPVSLKQQTSRQHCQDKPQRHQIITASQTRYNFRSRQNELHRQEQQQTRQQQKHYRTEQRPTVKQERPRERDSAHEILSWLTEPALPSAGDDLKTRIADDADGGRGGVGKARYWRVGSGSRGDDDVESQRRSDRKSKGMRKKTKLKLNPKNWVRNVGRKYIMMIIWLIINAFIFWRTYDHYKCSPKYFYLHQMLGSWLCVSRGTASVLNLNCAAVLLPSCRLILTFLRNSGARVFKSNVHAIFDEAKSFHILCAAVVVLCSVIHFVAHMLNAVNFSKYYNSRWPEINVARHRMEDPLQLLMRTIPGITGFLLLIILIVISISSLKFFRNSNYNLFKSIHNFFVLFYLILLVHPSLSGLLTEQSNVKDHLPGCKLNTSMPGKPDVPIPEPESYVLADGSVIRPERDAGMCSVEPTFVPQPTETWKWLLPPLLLFLLDFLLRLVFRRSFSPVIVDVRRCVGRGCCVGDEDDAVAGEVVQLVVRVSGATFRPNPAQFVLLRCPDVSLFEWHPYTITKVPRGETQTFTLHIRSLGDWSHKLVSRLIRPTITLSTPNTYPNVEMDGPFCSPSEDLLNFKTSVCVAGGVGITPCVSVLNHINDDFGNVSGRFDRIYIYWAAKEPSLFFCFLNLFVEISTKLWRQNRPDALDVNFYVTNSREMEIEEKFSHHANFQFLKSRVKFHRPKWKKIFQRISASHSREEIGVFCCGPKSLNDCIRKNCCKPSLSNSPSFSFYHESFS